MGAKQRANNEITASQSQQAQERANSAALNPSALGNLPSRFRAETGLSLMEVVVAMALMAIIMTVSAQSGAEMLERWQYRAVVKDVRNRIAGMPLKAALERKTVNLSDMSTTQLGLPEGWTIEEQVPLVFSSSGLCSDAEFALVDPSGRLHQYIVTPPECLPRSPS